MTLSRTPREWYSRSVTTPGDRLFIAATRGLSVRRNAPRLALGVALWTSGCLSPATSGPDLVERGDYGLELGEFGTRCRVKAEVREVSGRLVVTGTRKAGPAPCGFGEAPVIELVNPAGEIVSRRTAQLHRYSHTIEVSHPPRVHPPRRAADTHEGFSAEFAGLPPAGSTIRLRRVDAPPQTTGAERPR